MGELTTMVSMLSTERNQLAAQYRSSHALESAWSDDTAPTAQDSKHSRSKCTAQATERADDGIPAFLIPVMY